MRPGLAEDILIAICMLLGLTSAMIGETMGVSPLKWLGIGMVVSSAVAIAVTRRR